MSKSKDKSEDRVAILNHADTPGYGLLKMTKAELIAQLVAYMKDNQLLRRQKRDVEAARDEAQETITSLHRVLANQAQALRDIAATK